MEKVKNIITKKEILKKINYLYHNYTFNINSRTLNINILNDLYILTNLPFNLYKQCLYLINISSYYTISKTAYLLCNFFNIPIIEDY